LISGLSVSDEEYAYEESFCDCAAHELWFVGSGKHSLEGQASSVPKASLTPIRSHADRLKDRRWIVPVSKLLPARYLIGIDVLTAFEPFVRKSALGDGGLTRPRSDQPPPRAAGDEARRPSSHDRFARPSSVLASEAGRPPPVEQRPTRRPAARPRDGNFPCLAHDDRELFVSWLCVRGHEGRASSSFAPSRSRRA